MITVYYDVTRLLHRSKFPTPTGIDRVDINYANYFFCSDEYEFIPVFHEKGVFFFVAEEFVVSLYAKWILNEETNINFEQLLIKYLRKVANTSDSPRCFDIGLTDKIKKQRKDVKAFYINTSHHGVGNREAYHAFRVLGNCRIVFYLHDIIPIDWPEYVKVGDDINHAKRVTAMAEMADFILVNSEYTKNRFLAFCDDNELRKPSVYVLFIGIEEKFLNFSTLKQETGVIGEVKTPYFVYVSTIEPRKNHLLLLHIWRQQFLLGNKKFPKLIIIGKRGWNNQNIIDILDRSSFVKESVIELSGLSDSQMVSIIKGARALLYPSFVEGWGMPIVECIAMGVPVVCSDIPAHRESGQGQVVYIDPVDGKEWLEWINKLATSDIERNDLIKKYANYKMPTWHGHFFELRKILISDRSIVVSARSINRREIIEKYSVLDKKIDAVTNVYKDDSELGFFARIMFNLLFKNTEPDRRGRLIRKFKTNPIAYLKDSKIKILRQIGNYIEQQE